MRSLSKSKGDKDMKKRVVSMLLCGILAMSMLAGCGGGDSEEAQKSKEAAQGGTSQGGSDTFTYVLDADTGNTLNPLTADDRYGLSVCNVLYSPLYRMNTDGSIDYILAESIEPSEDGLTYTVKLKNGLKWSDGEALTADDVVFTYNAQMENGTALQVNGQNITVTKVDDQTIEFGLPAISANFTEVLAAEHFILPEHIFADKGSFDINLLQDDVVGNGPYTLKEYQGGQHFQFEANPNYALGEPSVKNVVYQIIEQSDTASLSMQNGDVNAWVGLPDAIGPFEGNDSYNITNYSEGRVAYVLLNQASADMQDKDYRTGILKALNREEIMTAGYTSEEFYKIGYSFLPQDNQYYTDDLEKYDQNIDEAKELTAGGPTTLQLTYMSSNAADGKMALAIQSELKEIGITVEINALEPAAFSKEQYNKEESEYDILIGGYVMGVDPYAYASLFVTGTDNLMKFNNPEVDELFARGNATLDEEERQAIYTEVQQKVADDAIFYSLGTNLRTLVTSANVGGLDEVKLVPIYTFGDLSKLTLK